MEELTFEGFDDPPRKTVRANVVPSTFFNQIKIPTTLCNWTFFLLKLRIWKMMKSHKKDIIGSKIEENYISLNFARNQIGSVLLVLTNYIFFTW